MRNLITSLGLVLLAGGCSMDSPAARATFRLVNESGRAISYRLDELELSRAGAPVSNRCEHDFVVGSGPAGEELALDDGASVDIAWVGCDSDEQIGSGPISFELPYGEPSVDIARVGDDGASAIRQDFEYPADGPIVITLN